MQLKKIALLLCLAILLIGAGSVSASAASISGMVVSVGNGESQTLELWNEISIPVRITQNPGAAMFSLDIHFDSSVLEYISCDSADSEMGSILAAGPSEEPDTLRIVGAFGQYTEDSNQTGLLVTLRFRAVGEGAGEIAVDPAQSQALRTDGTAVLMAASESASVTVTKGVTTLSAGTAADVAEGWMVTIPVQISTNPGVAGYAIDIIYDDSCLEFVRCENGDTIEHLLAYGPSQEASEPTIRVVGAQSGDATGNGVLFRLIFTVKEGAKGELPIQISTGSGLMNAASEEISFAVQDGTVSLQNSGGGVTTAAILAVIAVVVVLGGGAAFVVVYRKRRANNASTV